MSGFLWFRHASERVAHRSRRKRAAAAVGASRLPKRVLFVCLANVCRSPYAEAASRRDSASWSFAPPEWHSAGLVGQDGRCPQLAIEIAAERGAPLGSHRALVVTRDLVAASDLIVVMEAYQAEELASRFGRRRGVLMLGDFDPEPISTRSIADPFGKSRQDYHACYDRIDRCLAALATQVRKTVSL